MSVLLCNGRLLGPDGWQDGALVVEGGRIAAVLPADRPLPRGARRVDLDGRLLMPGFVDTQVNGGGGVLFNDAPNVEGITAIGRAHAAHGTTAFLPTLISDRLEVIERGLDAVDMAIRDGVPGVVGIHIEGPFLAASRVGIHDPGRLAVLDPTSLELLCRPRRGRVLLTLAPELARPADLLRLRDAGVILAAGHSAATAGEVEVALAHGLSGFTHLYNAMSPTTAREPGVVGAALADEESYCGIIADGKHVDPRVLKLALRTKRADRFMLVTDAMPAVGTDLRQFDLHGRTIFVEQQWCVDAEGRLAGTLLTMAAAVRNAVALLGVSLESAVRMASENPARFLGLLPLHGVLAPGARADFVVADGTLDSLETWIGGQRLC
jgi:N-acetylglucosamine-6-phosphate deacetylase